MNETPQAHASQIPVQLLVMDVDSTFINEEVIDLIAAHAGVGDKVADITDVWTFARDTTSRDPNWKLVGTGSGH